MKPEHKERYYRFVARVLRDAKNWESRYGDLEYSIVTKREGNVLDVSEKYLFNQDTFSKSMYGVGAEEADEIIVSFTAGANFIPKQTFSMPRNEVKIPPSNIDLGSSLGNIGEGGNLGGLLGQVITLQSQLGQVQLETNYKQRIQQLEFQLETVQSKYEDALQRKDEKLDELQKKKDELQEKIIELTTEVQKFTSKEKAQEDVRFLKEMGTSLGSLYVAYDAMKQQDKEVKADLMQFSQMLAGLPASGALPAAAQPPQKQESEFLSSSHGETRKDLQAKLFQAMNAMDDDSFGVLFDVFRYSGTNPQEFQAFVQTINQE